jgi:hypothetical protein
MDAKKLPPSAYELKEGEEYVPYTYGMSLPEFTIKAAVAGILLGIVFGAANTYLGLKAGLTISTSIPVAVLTVVTFRILESFGLRHSILESNMSQTIGSASSSVASGVLFTIPALFIWGMSPAWRQITLLTMAGGLIGVLFMVPLRRYLIKREHGKLPYPEGMACAEVLVAAEGGGRQAAGVFWGLGIGMLFKLITDGIKLVPGTFQVLLGYKASLAISVSPPLIGVGYILGMRIATVMVAGGALSAFVIIPAINFWGAGLNAPLFPETELLIRDMSAREIWHRYVRYIGAGAVATGGIITLIRSIPTMIESFKLGLGQIAQRVGAVRERTDDDLPFRTVLVLLVAVLLVLTLVPGILGYLDSVPARGVASILIAIFAFFFVTVSSRIVGLVGVTSNPTSGMTIATLLGTSLVFFLLGWTDPRRFGRIGAPGPAGRVDEARDRRRARAEPALDDDLHRCGHRTRRVPVQDSRAGVCRRCLPAAIHDGGSVPRWPRTVGADAPAGTGRIRASAGGGRVVRIWARRRRWAHGRAPGALGGGAGRRADPRVPAPTPRCRSAGTRAGHDLCDAGPACVARTEEAGTGLSQCRHLHTSLPGPWSPSVPRSRARWVSALACSRSRCWCSSIPGSSPGRCCFPRSR